MLQKESMFCLFVYFQAERHWYFSLRFWTYKNISGTFFVICFLLNRWFLLFCGILICNCISRAYLVDVSPGKTQIRVRCLDFNESVIHSRWLWVIKALNTCAVPFVFFLHRLKTAVVPFQMQFHISKQQRQLVWWLLESKYFVLLFSTFFNYHIHQANLCWCNWNSKYTNHSLHICWWKLKAPRLRFMLCFGFQGH